MSGQIDSTSVKGKFPPAATKRRPSAVTILNLQQPCVGAFSRAGVISDFLSSPDESPVWTFPFSLNEFVRRQNRPWRVIRVGNRAAEVAPAKAAGVGAGEGVALGVLAGEEPVEALRAEQLGNVLARAGEGVDGEGGVPGGEVGVDRTATVRADRGGEELEAFANHRSPRFHRG